MTRLLQVTKITTTTKKRVRPQTDTIRLVSGKLVLQGGGPVVWDGRFDRFLEKHVKNTKNNKKRVDRRPQAFFLAKDGFKNAKNAKKAINLVGN